MHCLVFEEVKEADMENMAREDLPDIKGTISRSVGSGVVSE